MDRTEAPLAGVRVLEICPGEAGAATRYLAELGADVVTVPTAAPAADPLAALAGSTAKRILRIDPASAEGGARIAALATEADILVEIRLDSAAPEILAGDLLSRIRKANPKAVILAMSPFGADNAFSHWQLTNTVAEALSGVLARSGWPNRDPLPPPGEFALHCAYNQAAWTVLMAYFHRLRTGQGDRIELSLLEAATQAMDPGFGIGGSATAGVPASQLPRGRPDVLHYYPVLRCKDGHVRICVLAPRQWQGMLEWMGRPEKYVDPEYNKLWTRFASPTLLPDIAALFAQKTRDELESELAACGVPMAPVLTLAEAIDSEQFTERRATTFVRDEHGRTVRVPNGLVEVDGHRAGTRSAEDMAPGAGWLSATRFDPAPEAVPPRRPFSGMTVLDLGVIIAGGEQARLFADHGATTLKLENRAFPDGVRQNQDGLPVSVNFAMGHRNKLGLGLNLRDPKGKELFLDLARKADIVLSNFKPGTLASLGLDFAAVAAINPAIVYGDSSAYGPTGPWRGRPGYGPLVRSSSGLTHLWAYPGGDGEFSDAMTVYPDHVCGRVVAIAVLALLIRRMRTGQGGETSLAQSEVIASHLGALIAAASLGEDRPARPDAPWGAYPAAGDDEWCAVTVRNDADWQALCRVIGRDDLAARPDLARPAGRRAAQRELDEAVSAWTAGHPPEEAAARLQAAGVPAARMLRVAELPDFSYYQDRGVFREAEHPTIPYSFKMEYRQFHSERIAPPDFGPAPLPGEQTARIMADLLGLSPAEIERLHEAGVLESTKATAVV